MRINTRLHGAVYKSLGAMFVGILVVWAVTFRHSTAVLYNLGVCAIYLTMYLGGPVIVARVRGDRISDGMPLGEFLRRPFATFTGPITGSQAWTQVCLIPGALLLCTVGMGVAVRVTMP